MRLYHYITYLIATLYFAMLAIAITSCRTPQPIAEKVVEVEKVVTKTDTLVYTQPDSASIQALLVCDSMGNVLIKQLTEEQGKTIALQAQLKQTNKGTALVVDCKADSLQMLVDKYREELQQKTEHNTTEVVEVQYIPWIVKVLAWIGGIVLAYILIRVCIKIAKLFV